MIEESTFFLNELSENNSREWFNDNRKVYEQSKANFSEFIEELIVEVQKLDPFITDVNAKNSLFRIFKDVRFSKNKEPYKTHFGGAMGKGGRKSEYPSYYLHLKPGGETFIGGGIYHPQPSILKAIREEIAFNTQSFETIIHSEDFVKTFKELEGDKLVRPPKGFDKELPGIEHLKRKDFLMLHKVSDAKATQKNFKQYCANTFAKMVPLNTFLRGPVYDVLENQE
jgi:uncharacterized protein (TIGR02453 family)